MNKFYIFSSLWNMYLVTNPKQVLVIILMQIKFLIKKAKKI